MEANSSEWDAYLADRQARSLSVVHIGLAPYWAGAANRAGVRPFCNGAGYSPSCNAPSPATPLPRSNVRPNPAFWRNLDAMVKAANDRELVVFLAGLLEPVGGDPANPNSPATDAQRYPSQTEATIFARWIAARLSGDHVIFSPGFDSPPATTGGMDLRGRIKAVGAEISRIAPRHLVTNHWSATSELTTASSCSQPNYSTYGMDELHNEAWLDFHMFQSGGICTLDRVTKRARELALDLETLTVPPTRKVSINGEATYDNGDSINGTNRNNRFRARQTSWLSTLTGAQGFTMGVGGAWDWGLCGQAAPNPCSPTTRFPTGWRSSLDTNTLVTVGDLASFRLIRGMVSWYPSAAYSQEQWRLTLNSSLPDSKKQVLLRDLHDIMAYLPEGPFLNIDAAGLAGDVSLRKWYIPTNATIDPDQGTISCSGICQFGNPASAQPLGSSDRVLLQPAESIDSMSWFGESSNFVQVFEGRYTIDETWGIWGELYDASYNLLGGPIRISDPAVSMARHPSVARDEEGGFLAVWEADADEDGVMEIRGRRLDRNGEPIGEEFVVSEGEGLEPQWPSVALDGPGNAVVVWEALIPGTGLKQVWSRRLDSGDRFDGDPVAESEPQTAWPQPRVASDRAGSVLVAWQQNDDETGSNRIVRRFVGREGRLLNDDVAASFSTQVLGLTKVVARRDGSFTVEWEELASGGSRGRYARGFEATGGPAGGWRAVTSSLTGGRTE